MQSGAPATYFDGTSPRPVAGILHARSGGLEFQPETGEERARAIGFVRFAYDQISETRADSAGYRLQIFVDAGESRELRFADRAMFEYIQSARRQNARGLPGILHAVGEWSTTRKVLVGALLLPLSIGAFILGIGGAHVLVPEIADRRLGDQAVPYLESGMEFCEDPELTSAVSEMMARLAGADAAGRFTVRIVREEEVNALALPNGNIYLFSGLIAESETAAEVAGVLAHEIGHIHQRHSMRQLIQALGFTYLATMILGAGFEELEVAETIGELASLAVFFKYSRDFEREADLYALGLLRDAGMNGQGLLDFFSRRIAESEAGAEAAGDEGLSLESVAREIPEFLSSHPADETRARYLSEALEFDSGHPGAALPAEAHWAQLRNRCSDAL